MPVSTGSCTGGHNFLATESRGFTRVNFFDLERGGYPCETKVKSLPVVFCTISSAPAGSL